MNITDTDINIIDCHVHASLQTDMDYLSRFLDSTGTKRANIIACSHSKCLSLAPHALKLKLKDGGFEKYYVYAAPDISGYYLHRDDLGEYFASNAKELLDMGCDGIKLLEGKPQMRKAVPIPDFDLPVWEAFWAYAEEVQLPILWHVNDPAEFWDKENAPAFAVSQGWLYDDSYVNNEDQYRQVLTVLSRHPKLRIIFAHFFFMSSDLERLSVILDSYPNIMIDMTPGIEMYENFSNNFEMSKAFFDKYYQRICYGSDIGGRCVLMGEEKVFDEIENRRRPKIVRDFLINEKEELIESDGHYIVGRPGFTMRCLGLSKEKLDAIMGNNFIRFTGLHPRMANKELIDSYSRKLEKLKRKFKEKS